MDQIRTLLSRCASFFRRERLDADLDDELQSHIELAMEENLRRGMPQEEARTAALRAFGGVTQTSEDFPSSKYSGAICATRSGSCGSRPGSP
jgi:hypothetical protein